MKKINKRTIAWAITLAVVLISSCFGIYRTMKDKRVEAEILFYGNYSVESDLSTKAGHAANAVAIAKKYLPESEYEPLSISINRLDDMKYPKDKYAASSEIDDEFNKLCAKLLNIKMKDSDINYLKGIKMDMSAINDILDNNLYNYVAEEYNRTVNSAPVVIFKHILGISTLQLYAE